MAHQEQRNVFEKVMELFISNGFDSMADVLKILLNEAMKMEREDPLAPGPISEPWSVGDTPMGISPRPSTHAWAG